MGMDIYQLKFCELNCEMAKPQGVNCDLPKNNNNEDNNQSQYIYN